MQTLIPSYKSDGKYTLINIHSNRDICDDFGNIVTVQFWDISQLKCFPTVINVTKYHFFSFFRNGWFHQHLPERAALNQYVSPMSARVQQAANQWRLQAKRLGNGLGFKFAPAIERKRRYTKDAIIKAIRFYSNNGVNRNVSN